MTPMLNKILGPRVAPEFQQAHPREYQLPAWMFGGAAILLVVSLFLPYWHLTLFAPQYPDGLTVTSYVNRLTGRVEEVNILNQYIGMKPLEDAARHEKRIAVAAISVLALLVVAAIEVHSPWAALLALPAALFPLGFLADLQFWLADFGLRLDPNAPLNMAVKPFVPHALGIGHIGQFSTIGAPSAGLMLSVIASVLIFAGLWWQRKIFRRSRNAERAALAEILKSRSESGV